MNNPVTRSCISPPKYNRDDKVLTLQGVMIIDCIHSEQKVGSGPWTYVYQCSPITKKGERHKTMRKQYFEEGNICPSNPTPEYIAAHGKT